jgi:YVTN family beta-propeller protein
VQDLLTDFTPCGEPRVVRLLANDGRALGSVAVSNDGKLVTVVYETFGEWEIEATHLALTRSLEEIPTGPSGLPQIGRFPFVSVHEPGRTRVTYAARLDDLGAVVGEPLIAAAQAGLIDRNDPTTPDDDERVGTWAEGAPLTTGPRGNVGTFFQYEAQACAVARTVGPDGGSVEISGGSPFVRAELIIPPGALEQPVEITVEPIPLTDVPIPPSGFPGLDDLVAGTAYDFGPDGLAFLVPARLVIEYDESALGGRPEADLTLLRFDGGVDRIPASVVDRDLNRISAFVDHFTVYVAAIEDGWAARLEESVAVADEVTITVLSRPEESVEETVGVTDEVSVNVLSTLRPDVAEAVAVADAVSIDVVPQPRSAVDESVGVSDEVTVTVLPVIRPGVDESVGVVDAVSINVLTTVRPAVAEAVGVSENVSINVVPAGPDPVEVYVALEEADSVAVLDAATNAVLRTIPVGSRPYAVAANPARSEVYVTNRGDATVSVISTVSQTVVATIPAADLIDPIDVAVSRDGSKAYVVDQAWSWVAAIDLSSRTLEPNLEGGPPGAWSITMDPVRDVAYVSGLDMVVAFDLAVGVPADTIPGFLASEHTAVTPDGSELWLTDVGNTDVLVVDLSTNTLVATIDGIVRPIGIAMGASQAWVASEPIVPIDIATRSVGAPIPVPADFTPARILLPADGRTAFVSEESSGTRVAVVDLTSGTVVSILPVGSAPAGLAVIEPN